MPRPKLKRAAEQVVVITGATSGIGLAVAEMLGAAGAKLFLVARNEAALRPLAERFEAEGRAAGYAVSRCRRPAGARTGGRGGDQAVRRLRHLGERRRRLHLWRFRRCSARGPAPPVRRGLLGRGARFDDRRFASPGARRGDRQYRQRVQRHGDPVPGTVWRGEVRGGGVHGGVPAGDPRRWGADLGHAREAGGDRHRVHGACAQPDGQPRGTRNPPPSYDPKLVARAVVHASQHPIRDIKVGGFGGGALVVANRWGPGMVDRIAALVGHATQTMKDAGAADRRDNFYELRADGAQRSTLGPFTRETSFVLEAQLLPVATTAALSGIVATAALLRLSGAAAVGAAAAGPGIIQVGGGRQRPEVPAETNGAASGVGSSIDGGTGETVDRGAP